MCCIFTCFGWMIDLIQRFWTFMMSCCISSAVCCLLLISAMAGIALGYNYSLAEYIDLKESNVSIFLKRGIFDDEISDLQLRRANDELLGKMTGGRSGPEAKGSDEETTSLRSGRRLDDSVFDGGDQYRYEGSLMKLTAKPPFEHTTPHLITEDSEMGSVISSYTKDTLDSLKAIQSVIDARRAYAQTIRGPTLSPVPTYPFNEVEHAKQVGPMDQQLPAVRRMMSDPYSIPTKNPARLAVPNPSLGEDINWVAPLRPVPYEKKFKELGIPFERMTFPSPITFKAGPIRPTPTVSTRAEGSVYLTKYNPITLFSTRPTEENEIPPYTKDPKVLSFKEKLMAENDRPIKKHKPSEEDYDYDVKGLPVRKRRSVYRNKIITNNEPSDIQHKQNVTIMNNMTKIEDQDDESKLSKYKISTHPEVDISIDTDKMPNQKMNILPKFHKQNNVSESHMVNMNTQENGVIGIEPSSEFVKNLNENGSLFQNMFTYVITRLQLIKERLSQSSENREFISASNGNLTENYNNDGQIINLFKNITVSTKSNTNFRCKVNMTLTFNKTQSVVRNFNTTEEGSVPPVLIHMVLPTAA